VEDHCGIRSEEQHLESFGCDHDESAAAANVRKDSDEESSSQSDSNTVPRGIIEDK
jgi:hypothetical protein